MTRLIEGRRRLDALRTTVRAVTKQIRDGKFDDTELLEHQLWGYREHEMELVREIAELENGDDGSAGVRVPRPPRPVPVSGAAAAPVSVQQVLLVSRLSEP